MISEWHRQCIHKTMHSFAHMRNTFDLYQGEIRGNCVQFGLKREAEDIAVHKTEAISVRVTPQIKAALRRAAHRDQRSLASLVIKILADWLAARKLMPDSGPRRRTG